MDLAGGTFAWARRLAQTALVGAKQYEGIAVEYGFGTFEGAAGDDIYRARERHAGGFRRRGIEHFDARDVVGRKILRIDMAGSALEGTGHVETIHRHGDVVVGYAVDGNPARNAEAGVDGDAGDELQQVADVALRRGAKFIGGDDVAHVRGKTLLVDRDRGPVHFARLGDDETREFLNYCTRDDGAFAETAQLEIVFSRSASPDGHSDCLCHQASAKRLNVGGAGRNAWEIVLADVVGEYFEARALNGDSRSLSVFAAAGVEDAAAQRSGRRTGLRGTEDGEPQGKKYAEDPLAGQ